MVGKEIPKRPEKSVTATPPKPEPNPAAVHKKPAQEEGPSRRGFISRALAILVGGLITVFPFAAGLAVFADPLRKRESKSGGRRDADGYVKIESASLDGLALNEPRRFVVIDDLTDAWNFFPEEPVGAVYLTKVSDEDVRALCVACPHAGCAVDYDSGEELFRCPCHDSSFKVDGEIANANSPAARGLDTLDTKVVEGIVWVKFEKFRSGIAERIAET
jgi:menaquinol-cytochrome c reductase iron-sulfur subunit